MLPLYEAKMIHHYDTHWATYEPDGSTRLMTADEKAGHVPPMPRYWVHESEIDKKLDGRWDNKPWFLGWRDICRATDARTFIATSLPRVAFGDPMLLAMPSEGRSELQAVWSSFVFDFVARQKSGGTHMKYFTTMQLPVATAEQIHGLPLQMDKPIGEWIGTQVDRLNAWPTGETTRDALRAELDALMLHVYGLSREDGEHVLDTFSIVKAKDLKAHGEYRTCRLILEAYDAMAKAIATGERYRSPFENEDAA